VLVASVVAVVTATAMPFRVPNPDIAQDCVTCGRGVADVFNNLLLFAPIGIGLALLDWRTPRAVLALLAFSIVLESAQLVIPGRHASVADVMLNGLGGASAFFVTPRLHVLLVLRARLASRLAVAAALLAAVLSAAPAWLFAPDYLPGGYFGMWTAKRKTLETYQGRVIDVHVGDRAIGSRRIEATDTVRALLAAGAPVRVRVILGPAPPGLAPVFGIVNDANDEQLLIAIDETDLVFRPRTRAVALGLGTPDFRSRGVLADAEPGDTASVTVWREAGGICLDVDTRRVCGMRVSLASGWSALIGGHTWPWAANGVATLLWAVCLTLPVGYLLRRRRESLVAVALLVGGIALAIGVAGVVAGGWDLTGLALGLMVGRGLHRLVRHRAPDRP